MQRLWIGVLFIISGYCAKAQGGINPFKFNTLGINDGLSASTVTCIFKDKRGFMWLGTQDGLNRYDGYEFQQYFHQKNDSNSIGENYVRDIVEDHQGDLWICTYSGGVSIYHQQNDRFTHLKNKPADKNSLVDNRTVCILCSSKNEVWIGTEHGLSVYNPELKQFKSYYNKNNIGVAEYWFTALCEDTNGNVWASTVDGKLIIFSKNNSPSLIYNIQQTFKEVNTINALCCDKNGTIWIGTNKGLFYKDTSQSSIPQLHAFNLFKGIRNVNQNITVLKNSTTSILWVGTESNGLISLDLSNNSFATYKNNIIDQTSISSNFIYSIYSDRMNNIWVGTEIGLSTHFPTQEKLISFTKDYTNVQQIIGVVWGVYCEDSIVLIGTSKSLFTLNRNTGKLTKIKGCGTEMDKNYYCFCKWHNDFLVGSSEGVLILKHKGNQYYTECLKEVELKTMVHKKVCNIVEYDSENIWLGTYENGLYKWNRNQHSIKKYESNTSRNSLSSEVINIIYKDKSGNFWFGTDNGFSKYIPKIDGFQNFLPSETEINTINKQYAYCFYDDGNNLWIGTYGGGLNCLNKSTGKFSFYTTKNGLCNNDIYCIEADYKQNLWLSTNKGISCFNTYNKTFSSYFDSDGAQGNEFDHWARYKNKKDEIIFGGNNGITIINQNKIKGDTAIPPVVITNIKVMDELYNTTIHHADVKEINLSYNENRLGFSFAALSYISSKNNQYKYMLKGLDTGYCKATSQHTVLYNNLSPGIYTFRVIASNNDGVWNTKGSTVTIVIHPPYYATWWFKSILVLIVSGILYAFYQYRINQLLAVQKIRNRIAQDLHDDIGATLGSIKVFSEVAKNRFHKNPDKVEEVLDKIGEASHDMIDKMSDIVWSVNPVNDSNEELLNRMKSFAAIMLNNNNIEYTFDADQLNNSIKMNMLERKNIFLIFKETIYNAIKYANCSLLTIQFIKENNILELMIKDNGKGFDLNNYNTLNGNGIKNIYARAREINAEVNISSEINKGTILKLKRKV